MVVAIGGNSFGMPFVRIAALGWFRRVICPAMLLFFLGGSTLAEISQESLSPGNPVLAAESADGLWERFQRPPNSAKPQTWWHWMNGNVTREGITADLEAMKSAGLGGFQLFDAGSSMPKGPVIYGSREWFDLLKHTWEEAARLKLEMGLHNCAGWSSSGGPWVPPEYGMQEAVMSESRVSGPAHLEVKLTQPPSRLGCYRDIAVLAFPRHSEESSDSANFLPAVTSSAPNFQAKALLDGNVKSAVTIPLPKPDAPQFIQFSFEKPYSACRLVIDPGPLERGFDGEFQASDDGVNFRKIIAFSLPYGASRRTFNFKKISSPLYRLLLTKPARAYYPDLALAEIRLDTVFQLDDFEQKAAFKRADAPIVDPRNTCVPEDEVIRFDSILDLTDKMKPGGTLAWDVPKGDWTILRIGHTPTGEKNHPAVPGGEGLECDKLSRKAVEFFWEGMMAKVIEAAGPLAGKTLTNILVDSYELIQAANWTPGFREEFLRRRGYDPTKYLATLTGRVVGNGEITERFLWDFRRTLADLFAENYSGTLARLAADKGLLLALEPYGTSPADDFLYAGPAAIPMTEFWSDSDPLSLAETTAPPASAAHIYGRTFIGAEAFTGRPDKSAWTNDPHTLKPVGDASYCSGVNRLYFHTFAHQPWVDRRPGMTMDKWGSHFDRTNTWWVQGRAWISYLSRCQFLLQQGRFVADALYFYGEGAPVGSRPRNPPLPTGYRFDQCNADVILNRLKVREGMLELPDGQSYRLLVLPPERQMTPPLLRKIQELVREGATVVGPSPIISPSLQDYPKCDEEVEVLAREVWGNVDGRTVTENRYGRGRVVWGKELSRVLADMSLPPDFETNTKEPAIRFLHRSTGEAEIYFVANLGGAFRQIECTFRVSGKLPEIWNPETGSRSIAPIYFDRDGRTCVPLSLKPKESVFVIFQGKQEGRDHLVSIGGETTKQEAFALAVESDGKVRLQTTRNGVWDLKWASGRESRVEVRGVPESVDVSGPWQIEFPPGRGAPENIKLDALASWTDNADPCVRYFSGTATYKKELEIPEVLFGEGRELLLDLGEVKNIAQVRLNGKDLGILWKPPFALPLTGVGKPGRNQLEIEITNLWPNRLIGDEQLPEDCSWKPERFKGDGEALNEWPRWMSENNPRMSGRIAFGTWRHWSKDDEPLPSGLLGPVRLIPLAVKRSE